MTDKEEEQYMNGKSLSELFRIYENSLRHSHYCPCACECFEELPYINYRTVQNHIITKYDVEAEKGYL